MKLIRTEDAVGHVLCHDLTQIIRGVTKDAVFRKGHIVAEEDIPVLLRMGKDTLYVWEKTEGMLHEDEAAEILSEICMGANLIRTAKPKEGKIDFSASCDGLLKIQRDGLLAVNQLGNMMIAARHGDFPVKKGEKIAGTRVIPLVIEERAMQQARKAAGDQPLLSVLPFHRKRAGVITTGNEVFYGRIEDTFTPVIVEKLEEYGSRMEQHLVLNDDPEAITAAILQMAGQGMELILCTGGMSVDPDDKTPLAIRNSAARVISYGAPVLPGAMFLLAYLEKDDRTIPVVGLPGCVMYARRTVFDLILPRLLAEDPVTEKELAALGEGGYCLSCPECTFPHCGFGK